MASPFKIHKELVFISVSKKDVIPIITAVQNVVIGTWIGNSFSSHPVIISYSFAHSKHSHIPTHHPRSFQKITKTHNLAFLIEQCSEVDGSFSQFEEQFDNIAECGVEIRYPDSFIIFQKKELQDALTVVEEFLDFHWFQFFDGQQMLPFFIGE
jgi:hypothetical protein